MSENEPEDTVSGIGDDQLPEDLVPSEDNPLAEGLDDGESPGDLLHDGRPADQDEGHEADGAQDGPGGASDEDADRG